MANIFKKFLSLISFKETKEYKDFYIPEVAEREKETPEGIIMTKKKRGLKNSFGSSDVNTNKVNTLVDDNKFATDIQSNINYLNTKFNVPVNKDFKIREINLTDNIKAFIAYMDGMVDRITINNSILKPLLKDIKSEIEKKGCQLEYVVTNILETNQTTEITKPSEAIYEILSGNTCIYIDGCDYCISCETKGFDKRSVEKPFTEGLVRGPQEAFNENLRTNVTLVRKIIKDNNLTTEFFKLGKRNNIQCAVMYINGLTNPAIVNEVKRRINSLNADMIMSDGMLEQFIEDSPWTLIPTILNTERPDRTASHILEGRVAIIADGSPNALIVPVTLHSFLHTSEEAFIRWPLGTLIRLIRAFAIFVAALLPALYIGLVDFHREMIPTDLMIAIISAKENVPFPTIVEILLMELAFELIREAGIRIPGIIGNTLGIIGALILGQAAVQANIVSPVLIIIVAVTGLGNFAIPNFSVAFAVRVIRFVFILAAAVLGFYGIGLVLLGVMALLVNMKSFGVPFLSATSPKTHFGLDVFTRAPVWKQEMRPDYLNPLDTRRQPKISREWTQENATNMEADTKLNNGDDSND
jgi:spore germination protein KA